jgi:elongation factor P--(R)-beta-lysine ligase
MNATPRSLAELRADAPIEAVELHGRVTLVDDESARLRIELDGVAVEVVLTTAPALRGGASLFGSFVRVRGGWDGRQVRAATLDVLHSPTRDLARADSDFAWGRAGALATLARRHQILRSIRAFFDQAGFIETETPAVVRSPGLELHLDALEVLGARGPHWLQTSPEYHMKRLLSAGMSRIYQLCKCYRRNEHGALHQPEFTMLEWYRAFAGSDELMRDTEQLVAQLAHGVHGSPRIPGIAAEIDVTPPWERLSVRDAFARYASVRMDDVVHDEDAFYRILVEQIEPQLGRGRPVFLTRYPANMAALARLCADDASVADRFEAYVDGVELCNGFGELTDAAEQRRRLELDRSRRKQLDRAVYPLDERFLDALEDGMPPSGGNALGVDRLVMLLLGVANIADVVAFAVDRA